MIKRRIRRKSRRVKKKVRKSKINKNILKRLKKLEKEKKKLEKEIQKLKKKISKKKKVSKRKISRKKKIIKKYFKYRLFNFFYQNEESGGEAYFRFQVVDLYPSYFHQEIFSRFTNFNKLMEYAIRHNIGNIIHTDFSIISLHYWRKIKTSKYKLSEKEIERERKKLKEKYGEIFLNITDKQSFLDSLKENHLTRDKRIPKKQILKAYDEGKPSISVFYILSFSLIRYYKLRNLPSLKLYGVIGL